MQRHEMIDAMRGLGLKGMAGAFDDAVTAGVQRKHTAMEILTDLLSAEGAHRHAASIRYRRQVAGRKGPRRVRVREHPDQ